MEIIVVVLVLALTVGLPLVIMVRALSGFRGTTGSIKGGVHTAAVIQSISETGMTISSPSTGPEAPVYELELMVAPPGGGTPYAAVCKHAIPRIFVPMILPGRMIGVLVDPASPDRVVPDWTRLNDTAAPEGETWFGGITFNGTPSAGGTGNVDVAFDRAGNPDVAGVAALAGAVRSGTVPTTRSSAAQLLATGTHGTATITSAMPLGKTMGQIDPTVDPAMRNDPLWIFTLEVQLAGQQPFPAVMGHRVPVSKLALVAPGVRLAVAVNQANRNQEVAIDWDKSPIDAA